MEIFKVTREIIMQHSLLSWFFSTLLLTQLLTAAPAVAAETTTTVKVNTIPVFSEIQLGQPRKDFQVLLSVEAPAAAAARTPIDVVAVLDVSDSMNEPAAVPSSERTTTRLDLLKTTAKFMVAHLEDGDRLSIVAFNDRPVKELSTGLLHMCADGRRNAMRSVDQLEARGGTALVPAFEEAVRVLDARQGAGRDNRLGFIVLLTDGEDTSGSSFTASAHRRAEVIRGGLGRYPVHAVGLGAAHDPEFLFYLAQDSHGTYSFVDDDNVGEVAGALAVSLAGLRTVAAVDTRVVLKAADAPSGVRIDRVDSGGHASRVGCAGTSCEVSVGVLYAGETKHFVVHLHVPATGAAEGGYHHCDGLDVCGHHRRHEHEQHLLAVSYSYKANPSAAAITVAAQGVFVRRSPSPAAALDGGGRQAAPAVPVPTHEVLRHIVRFELLEMVAGVVHDRGELITSGGGARAADVLQLRWEEFRACHQFWAGGGVDLLGGLEKEVDGMVRGLRAGAAAYVYAWLSSRQMQRAASIGSPEKAVAEFLTPAMRHLLEEARKWPRWPPAAKPAGRNDVQRAGCVDGGLEMVEQRLELWSKLKRDVQRLVAFQEQAAAAVEDDDEQQLLADVFQEASIEAIDRAMHRDIYLAVVYASKQRRCHSSGANKCTENSALD